MAADVRSRVDTPGQAPVPSILAATGRVATRRACRSRRAVRAAFK